MSARKVEQASLARVQQQIDRLREELDWTLDSVDILTRNGQHQAAIDLVEAQRTDLQLIVDGVARDTANETPRPIRPSWRTALVAIAAVLALFGVGVAIVDQAASETEARQQAHRSRAHPTDLIQKTGGTHDGVVARVRAASAARTAVTVSDDGPRTSPRRARSGLNHLRAPDEDHTPALEIPSETNKPIVAAGSMLARS